MPEGGLKAIAGEGPARTPDRGLDSRLDAGLNPQLDPSPDRVLDDRNAAT